ncbi:hypothetical protein LLH06_12085 [Mucilaginibacter daejeonensis]|uniref:hypothetical protein n=1 Tax=Mucilaginibacter daejeonensis TaxID=398049 RepID=UPI001D16FC90|nr:hypothetical protein [Mucilaginibacter daejeonensis]UEG51704.1 hypothetical protein LLH06_12085 [Mucilaginibacter daejeonensis]
MHQKDSYILYALLLAFTIQVYAQDPAKPNAVKMATSKKGRASCCTSKTPPRFGLRSATSTQLTNATDRTHQRKHD